MRPSRAIVIAGSTVVLAIGCGSDEPDAGPGGGPGGAAGAGGAAGSAGSSGLGGVGGSAGTSGAGGRAPVCSGRAPPPQLAGTTYYVATTGSDAGPGTQVEPFATIQRGVDAVLPGDTVIVMDGTYTGAPGEPIVSMTQGGSPGNWVWLRAEHAFGATLDGQNAASDGIRLTNGIGFVRVEGFEIRGIAVDGSSTGITLYSGGHDSEIVGNHIHDIGHVCTDTQNGLCAIFVQQPNVLIAENRIHDVGRFQPGENGCNPTNTYWQNHDHGVYVDGNTDASAPGATDITIVNNVFHDLEGGWPIHLYPGTLSGIRILHNTFARENPNRDGHVIVDAIVSDMQIVNNVFFQPRGAAVNLASTALTSVTVSNNLTDSGAMLNVPAPSGVSLQSNFTDTQPGFVDATGLDFHLQSSSAAVDQGADLGELVPIDLDGCARPSGGGFDIGADELLP